jgi:carboxylesterase type B
MSAPTMHQGHQGYQGHQGQPSECARATSANESRFRITAPITPARAARVIALDDAAAAAAHRVAGRAWATARFYTCEGAGPGADEAWLRGFDGAPAGLAEVLHGSDVVVVLATEDSGAPGAAAIGRACGERGITTAGVVLGDGFEADDAVAALRPHARVLLLSADESDVTELLTALRV